ncbi:MAG: TetR/AcrR family transcriptional regulator [Candidatus Methanomethylophilaceae archaeon]
MINMERTDSARALLDATRRLLTGREDIDGITTRAIAEEAGVNTAMINYHFGSKDGLMKAAIEEMIEKSSEDMYGHDRDLSPKESIIGFIDDIGTDLTRYERFSRIYIPDILLNETISLPDRILPYVCRILPDRSISDCRMISYSIISIFQLMFYRTDAIHAYSGIDLRDPETRSGWIRRIVDSFLGV